MSFDPSTIASRLSEAPKDCHRYEVDDRGLFCRHCGRTAWRHTRNKGLSATDKARALISED